MLKRGNEIGIVTIKTEEKQGCDTLKEIHYNINSLMFKYQQKYIDKCTANKIIDKMSDFIFNLKELKTPSCAETKKNQIIAQLEANRDTLRNYERNVSIEGSDIPKIQKMIDYQVATYLKDKDKLTVQKTMAYLEDMAWLMDNFIIKPECCGKMDTTSFLSMNKELIQWIIGKYSIM